MSPGCAAYKCHHVGSAAARCRPALARAGRSVPGRGSPASAAWGPAATLGGLWGRDGNVGKLSAVEGVPQTHMSKPNLQGGLEVFRSVQKCLEQEGGDLVKETPYPLMDERMWKM